MFSRKELTSDSGCFSAIIKGGGSAGGQEDNAKQDDIGPGKISYQSLWPRILFVDVKPGDPAGRESLDH